VNDSRHVDIRADIYSLGCTLYYLLTGRTPFPSGSALDKALSHCDKTPQSVAELRADLPPELVRIIERMMAKQPSDRFQTPVEVAQALVPFTKSGADAALPQAIVADLLPVAVPPTQPDLSPAPQLVLTEELPKPRRKRFKPKPKAGSWRRNPVGLIIGVGIVGLCLIGGLIALRNLFGGGGPFGDKPPVTSPDLTQRTPSGANAKEPRRSASVSGSASTQTSTAPPVVHGRKRVLLVIPFKNFWHEDFDRVTKALQRFDDAVNVTVASSQLGEAQPDGNGRPVSVASALADARPSDFDAVIFCGGQGVLAEFTRDTPFHDQATRFIHGMLDLEKPVAAICGGPAVLADAGVLKGKKATCFAANDQRYRTKLIEGGATMTPNAGGVVEDGLLITGQGPYAAEYLVGMVMRQIGIDQRKRF
jgi:putative intracellular protease/amidase